MGVQSCMNHYYCTILYRIIRLLTLTEELFVSVIDDEGPMLSELLANIIYGNKL